MTCVTVTTDHRHVEAQVEAVLATVDEVIPVMTSQKKYNPLN
jgi:hypothetical protein